MRQPMRPPTTDHGPQTGAQVSDSLMLGYIFAAAHAKCGLRVCCACGKWLGLARELGEGLVTHGYCDRCLAAALAEIERLSPDVGAVSRLETSSGAALGQVSGAVNCDRAGSRRLADEAKTPPRPPSANSTAGPVVFPWVAEGFKPEVSHVA